MLKNYVIRPISYFKCFLLFVLFLSYHTLTAQKQIGADSIINIDFEKIESEKTTINYTLSQLVSSIEADIRRNRKIEIPEGATEFEKLICIARRIQHNDSQLVAIRLFKTLLEFECYRTKGEKLYLNLLIGTSLNYIGAPLIAKNFINPIFPDILYEIEDPNIQGFLLNHHANLLINIDSIQQAHDAYKKVLSIFTKAENKGEIFTTRNNLGFTFQLLGKYDSAKTYYTENQKEIYAELNPVLYAFAFGNYGSVMLSENKPDSAIFYMHKEVAILNSIPSDEGLSNTYSTMASAFIQVNKIDSADHYFHMALEESKKHRNLSTTVRNYQNLLTVYAIKDNAPKLAAFLKNYFSLNDSLKKALNVKRVSDELKISRFLNIFEETEESKRRTDSLEVRNRELGYAIITLIFIVILLAFVTIYRYRNRNKLQEKNLELKNKNIELKNSYSIISDSNKKNGILLKELHHRVKNNLQIISSLFNLQLNASNLNYEAQQVFKNAKSRIYSISLVHKKIYQSDNVSTLDFEEYIRDFSDELLKATPNEVSMSIEIQRNPISIESAIPLGLIFNELFTNSLKHAKRHDLLEISIKHIDLKNTEKFIYTDNGVGVKKIEFMKERENSIGVTLIYLLGEQLNAKIEYKEAVDKEHGFWLSIEGNFE